MPRRERWTNKRLKRGDKSGNDFANTNTGADGCGGGDWLAGWLAGGKCIRQIGGGGGGGGEAASLRRRHLPLRCTKVDIGSFDTPEDRYCLSEVEDEKSWME